MKTARRTLRPTLVFIFLLWAVHSSAGGGLERLRHVCRNLLGLKTSIEQGALENPIKTAGQTNLATAALQPSISLESVRQHLGSLNMWRVVNQNIAHHLSSSLFRTLATRTYFALDSVQPFSDEQDRINLQIVSDYLQVIVKRLARGEKGTDLVRETQKEWTTLTEEFVHMGRIKSERSVYISSFLNGLLVPLVEAGSGGVKGTESYLQMPISMRSMTLADILIAEYSLNQDPRGSQVNFISRPDSSPEIDLSVWSLLREGFGKSFYRPEATIFDWRLGSEDFNNGVSERWGADAFKGQWLFHRLAELVHGFLNPSADDYKSAEVLAQYIHQQLVTLINKELPPVGIQRGESDKREEKLFAIGFDPRLLRSYEKLVPYYKEQFIRIAQVLLRSRGPAVK